MPENNKCITEFDERLTEDFLLRISAYFCRNGTSAEAGSVAASGYNEIFTIKTYTIIFNKHLFNTASNFIRL